MSLPQLRWETLVLFAIVGAVLFWRLRRMAKEQELKPARLWILPIVLFLVLGNTTIAAPPPLWGLAIMLVAAAVGGLIGWKRGQFTQIRREGDKWMQKSSPTAMILLVAVIVGKIVFREALGGDALPDAGKPLDSNAQIVANALLALIIAMVSATRIEMALRCRRIEAGEQAEGCG